MADPKGFLTTRRVKIPRRPVTLRVRDYRQVYEALPESEVRAQASRCMDCGVPFCNTGCPLHNLIPEWNDATYRDDWQTAIDRLHATNNFPEFTGTLCPAPCENACVLTINDDPVAIKEVERTIAEHAWNQGWIVPRPPQTRLGTSVAVVGSGPAGLAAAQQLNRAGHHVTVYERDDTIGGLLVYGIPDFKIEKWMVERRVQQLADEGIVFRTNSHVGVDPTIAALRAEHDAIVLAIGALAGRDIDVEGREFDGIHLAMDYLVQQNRRVARRTIDQPTITAAGKRVVIIGGGDTGADCLGNVHRERCASVEVLTRGPRPPDAADPLDWPDVPYVLRSWPAHEEGGNREFDVRIAGFTGDGGCVRGVRVRRRDTDEEHVIEADLVLLAIGFRGPVLDDAAAELALDTTAAGAIACNAQYETSVPRVFVTGDAMRGASLIVTAIADGRQTARAVDAALTGDSLLPG